MHTKRGGPISALIVGTIFTVVGGSVAYFFGWPMIVEAKASQSWPSTSGKITVSKVESHRGKESTTMYAPHIEYVFEVDGVRHTGSQVWVSGGGSSSSPAGARNVVARYPVGKEAEVFYDPAAPGVCALEPGTTWTSYMPFGIGMLFLVIGVILAGTVVLKLAVGAAVIGAAATGAIGNAAIPTNETFEPTNGQPRPGPNEDDGIGIS